jgi:putative ABC transport system permease protein
VLIAAVGVAIYVVANGLLRSLRETQDAYYERYRLAHVFATAKRAPVHLERDLAAIPGVRAVGSAIAFNTLLDIDGMSEPVNGLLVSQPEPDGINQIHIRAGRRVNPRSTSEVVLSEAFAQAHGFEPGDSFDATFKGAKRRLQVVGIALSPEYVFFFIPGSMVPDDRRGGVMWMDRTAMGEIFDLDRSFNQVGMTLLPGASEAEVRRRTDEILRPYGGAGAFGRADHMSIATLDAEMRQLRSTVLISTPTFVGIVAFLLHMVMGRHVQTERERIGALKAIGYGNGRVAWHYCSFVLALVSGGLLLGMVAGAYLGQVMTASYSSRFHFPFLVYRLDPGIFVQATVILLGAGVLGAMSSVWRAASLPPAVAMRPPPPPVYGDTLLERLLSPRVDPPTRMLLRYIVRWPLRSLATVAGIAAAMAMVVAPLNVSASLDHMVDTHFFRAERQTVTVSFAEQQPRRVEAAAKRWPGVIAVEPFRSAMANISFRGKTRRVWITGRRPAGELSRPLDSRLGGIELPPEGLIVAETMAAWLGARPGDALNVEFTDYDVPARIVPLAAVYRSYIGQTFFTAFMEQRALNRLLEEGPVLNGVHLRVDAGRVGDLQETLKQTPQIFGATSQLASLRGMRSIIREAMGLTVLNGLIAALITMAVVYNTIRISLTERRRELATMCLIGYSRGAAWYVLMGEIAVLTVAAVPVGYAAGYGLSWLQTEGASNEVFRVPLWFDVSSLGFATLVVLAALAAAGVFVWRQIGRLDLVGAIKSTE